MYQCDPALLCWSDCTDQRMTTKCIQESYRLINGGTELAGKGVQADCDAGPVRFLGEILCGASIDPSNIV